MRRMFSKAQIEAMGGLSLYRHTMIVTGATGSLTLYTTSDVKFTSVLQINKCINFTSFDNGILLFGNFNGPTSLVSIIGFANGNLIGPTSAGTGLQTVSLASGAAVDDFVDKVQ